MQRTSENPEGRRVERSRGAAVRRDEVVVRRATGEEHFLRGVRYPPQNLRRGVDTPQENTLMKFHAKIVIFQHFLPKNA